MTRPLRICALGAATSPHVVARAEVFRRFGHDVSLVSPVPGCADGLPVVAPRRRGGLSRYVSFAEILGLVAKQRADIYHAHYAAEPTTWAAWLCGKRPLVVSVMGGDVLFEEQGTLGPLGRWLTQASLRAADLVTVKSELLAERVASFGVPAERIRVVVWGVERNIFHSLPAQREKVRAEWDIPPDSMLVFSPRPLQPLYNQHVMVEALRAVPGAVLAISTFQADEDYARQVRERGAACGVSDRVRLVPPRPFRDMAAAYSAADIVLSLPSSDGFPQSVLEAMACRVPVVMSNLDRYREYFEHGRSASMVRVAPEPVAAALCELIASPQLREQLSAAAAAIVAERCDFNSQAAAVERDFQRLAPMNARRRT